MGSILSVSEIKGLTSGGNANTINVASGHKLTGAVGSIAAPGAVIQFKQHVGQNLSGQTWSGSSGAGVLYGANRASRTYTEARTVTITPTYTSSILYCVGMTGWSSMTSTATMAHGTIITRNDTESIDNCDYPWYAHSYITSSNLYYPAEVVVGPFRPSSTSAQTIRLRPYVYLEGGNTGTGRYLNASLFIMEIAQ